MAFSILSSVNSIIKYNVTTLAPGDITSNLLLYYKCKSGDISGTSLTDYSGNSYTATLNGGGITISSNTCPKASYAITLSTSSNQYITFPTITCSSGYFSLASWVNIKSTTTSYARLLNFYPGAGGANYLQLICIGSPTSNTLFVAGLENNYSSNGYFYPLGSSGNLSVGWHHLVIVVKSGQPLAFYIDNVKYTSSYNAGTLSNSNQIANGMIGRDTANNVSNFDFCEYRIYNRALNVNDVNTLYNYTQV
jgi:hypothetical protein